MSTHDKTELDQLGSDVRDQLSLPEQRSPANISDRSSAASWNTPVSTAKSASTPSSVSWDTPKSFKSPGVQAEVVRETDTDDNALLRSPVMSTIMVLNDEPPPYTFDEDQGLWKPLKYIPDPLDYSSNRSRESASLIENPISAASIPHPSPSSSQTYRNKSLSRISFRRNRDEYPGSVKERDTFARKYGTICIATIFIVFLMILSLTAKFLVNTTLSL